MRRLTDEERIALREVGPPGEGPVSPATLPPSASPKAGATGAAYLRSPQGKNIRVSRQARAYLRSPQGKNIRVSRQARAMKRAPSGASPRGAARALMFDDYARASSA